MTAVGPLSASPVTSPAMPKVKCTPGGKQIHDATITFRTNAAATAQLWNMGFLSHKSNPRFLETHPFIVGDPKIVDASKYPVSLKTVEKQRHYLEEASKGLHQELQEIDAFLKNPVVSGPAATKRVTLLLNIALVEKQKEIDGCSENLKQPRASLAECEASIATYQKDLQVPNLTATTIKLIQSRIQDVNRTIDRLKSAIQRDEETVRKCKLEQELGNDYLHGKGTLPQFIKEFFERMFKLYSKQLAQLARPISDSATVKTSISLNNWLARISFFQNLKVTNPPTLKSVPAFSVVSLHQANPGDTSIPVMPLLFSAQGDEIVFRLFFDDAGNQLGALATDCQNASAAMPIKVFPDSLSTLSATSSWNNIQLNVVSEAALKQLQKPAAKQEIMANGFNVLLLKFWKRDLTKSYPAGQFVTRQHMNRTGVTAGYIQKLNAPLLLIHEGALEYVEDSALLLKVGGVAHTVLPSGDAMERLLDEVVEESDKVLTSFA